MEQSLLDCMQVLGGGPGDLTVTSPGKDRRGAEASGIIVIWDSFNTHSLSILDVPSTVLIMGPSESSPSGWGDSVNRTLGQLA